MTTDPSKRLILGAGVSAAALGLGAALWLKTTKNSSQGAHRHTLAGLSLPDSAGKILDLSAYTKRPVLINFWATWCPPCIEELPLLNAFYQEHAAKNIQLLGIAIDKLESVRTFTAKLPLAFPNVIAGFEGLDLVRSLGNSSGGLPFTVILSPQSAVLYSKSGQLHADELNRCLPLLMTI